MKNENQLNKICKVCGHPKDEHHSHVSPDLTGNKIKHIGCMVRVKIDYIEDFLGKGNTMPIGHTCSCHGVKENTYLKSGIKNMLKKLKTLDKSLSQNIYRRRELMNYIKDFRKDIKENPKNLLWWELEGIKV